MVMGLLSGFYPSQLTRVMGAWAAANGIGQAIGPPVGGLISDWVGWRYIFVTIAVACAVVVTPDVAVRAGPSGPRATALHMPGAILLTVGMGDAAGRDHRREPARNARSGWSASSRSPASPRCSGTRVVSRGRARRR